MEGKIKFNSKFKGNILKFISCMVISILIFSNVNIGIVKAANILDDIYISEIGYKNDMEEIAEPFIESLEVEGTLKGCEDIDLYYRYYLAEEPKASIVISHGFSEYLERYNEIIYYFIKSGYNVFIMEHRGHGRSGVLGQEDKTQVHVESFDYYIKDFKNFIDNIVVPINGDKKLFLFAHSMGGAIGVNILEEYPEYFDAAVLSAPMLEINTGSVPNFLAKICAGIYKIFNIEDKYVLGKGPYEDSYSVEGSGTNSKNRFKYNNDIVISNEILQRGGPSFNWLYESFKNTKMITKKANIEKIEAPILLFQAGNDDYVNSGGQDKLNKYAKECEKVFVEEAKHEFYREVDNIQKDYLENILDFYEKNI